MEELLTWLPLAAAVIVFVVLPISWALYSERKRRQQRERTSRERDATVARMVQEMGVPLLTGSSVTQPLSAGKHTPFVEETSAFGSSARIVRQPQFERQFTLHRPPWRICVTEASMFGSTSGAGSGLETFWEYRLETLTKLTPSLKVVPTLPKIPYRILGISSPQPGHGQVDMDQEARRPPQGSARWEEFPIPAAYAEKFTCFTDDPAFAAKVLNEGNLALLAEYYADFDFVLTLSDGLAYGVVHHGLDGLAHGTVRFRADGARSVLKRVDLLAGFLDRIPQEVWLTAAREVTAGS
jgi:hypothetical protein